MIIHDVEQRTPEWFLLRHDKPTSSEYSKVITAGGAESSQLSDYAIDLACNKYAGKDICTTFKGNFHTDRGNELEPEALIHYEFMTDNEVTPVGFITDDLMRCGASTDGLVNQKGGVEAKCLSPKYHFKAYKYYRETGKAPLEYKPQVQGEILIAELDWVDMIFYHPDLPSFVVRCYPDLKYIALLKSLLNKVIIERDEALKMMEN